MQSIVKRLDFVGAWIQLLWRRMVHLVNGVKVVEELLEGFRLQLLYNLACLVGLFLHPMKEAFGIFCIRFQDVLLVLGWLR